MSGFSFGTDPEFMVKNSNEEIVSAIGKVPGTSGKRHKVGKYTFYSDNVLAEFTIPPASTSDSAVDNIRTALHVLKDLLAVYGCKPITQASYTYPNSELLHPEARRAGCKPEACVYELKTAKSPEGIFEKSGFRTGGGHVHLGTKLLKKDQYAAISTIRMMDLYLGVMSIWLDTDPTSRDRKKIYGQAGRFRLPKHGVEYRSLGNYWLSSPKLVNFIFDVSDFVVKFVEDKKHEQWWEIDFKTIKDENAWSKKGFNVANCHICHGYDKADLRSAVDTMDKRKGKKYLKMIEDTLPSKIWKRFEQLSGVKYDFSKEWNLK